LRSSKGLAHLIPCLHVLRQADTKFAKEVEVLRRFFKLMQDDPDRAWYGYQSVVAANEQLAIEALLVTDELFRNSNVSTRRQYVRLVESVRENGGQVYIFSSMHVSGQQLQQVAGVAAVLRFPMPDLEELEQRALEHELEKETPSPAEEESVRPDDPYRRIKEDMADMGFG
jgi:protein pelota